MFESKILNIDSGDSGTKQTLEIMKKTVLEGTKDPAIVPIARTLVAGVQEKDILGEALALFRYVKDHIRYVKDAYGRETIVYPRTTMELGSGDCDCKAVLFASLAHAIGIPSRFTAVKLSGRDIYSHVFPELLINGKWYPAELTLKDAQFGVDYSNAIAKMSVEVFPNAEDGGVKMWEQVMVELVKANKVFYPTSKEINGLDGWYESLYGSVSGWQEQLKKILGILKEAPRIPEYARTGEQVSSSQDALMAWVKQPFTLVLAAVLVIMALKQRKISFGKAKK